MPRNKANLLAHLALFIVALIYGGNYIVSKEIMGGEFVAPFALVLLRTSTGLVCFVALHFILIKEKVHRSDIPQFILCAVLGVAINQTLFLKGLDQTTPIHAALILTTTPITILIMSSIVLRERITRPKIAGIALGFLGAVLLILKSGHVGFDSHQLMGDLMVFGNTISFGMYLVLVKKLLRKYHPITVVKWVFIFGFLFTIPLGYSELRMVDFESFSRLVWFGVAYVMLLVTVGTYLLNTLALNSLRATTVSIYIYLQPLIASTLSLMLGKETFSMTMLISAALIFTGVYLVSMRQDSPKSS